jgi:PIN domain nuclease of toxin-antitoxin system
VIEGSASKQGVWLSSISIWEVAKKVEKNELVLDRPIRQWLDVALSKEGLFVAELTQDVLIESCELPKPFHGDPADQMIVATVRHHRGRLITQDAAIRGYPHVVTVW